MSKKNRYFRLIRISDGRLKTLKKTQPNKNAFNRRLWVEAARLIDISPNWKLL